MKMKKNLCLRCLILRYMKKNIGIDIVVHLQPCLQYNALIGEKKEKHLFIHMFTVVELLST